MTWHVLNICILLGAVSLPVAAQTPPAPPASRPAPRNPKAAGAPAPVQPAARASRIDSAEVAPFIAQINQLRTQLLARSSWADLGDRCSPGALRVFAKDTSAEGAADIDRMLKRIEEIIVVMGAGQGVDDADGRLLVRSVMAWEAGIDRPFWDASGEPPKPAFATGLTGDYPDPNSERCLASPRSSDTVTVVVPAVTDADLHSASVIRLKAYLGASAVNHARNEFYTAHRNEPGAALEYILLAPVVRWNEWAVVMVTRPIEEGGVDLGKKGNGGAVYLMRRNKGQWRLFAVSRSWGR